jgi:SAM-dependent MidA family methyltransferase
MSKKPEAPGLDTAYLLRLKATQQLSSKDILRNSLGHAQATVEGIEYPFEVYPAARFDRKASEEFGNLVSGIVRSGHIDTMQAVINQETARFKPKTVDDFVKYYYNLGIRANGPVIKDKAVLTFGQFVLAANFDSNIGYYTSNFGIGRASDKPSAFFTPLELDPSYGLAYANLAVKAFEALNSGTEFTHAEPFRIFLVGDGEGKIMAQIIDKLRNGVIDPDLCQIIVIDKSREAVLKPRQVIPEEERKKYRALYIQTDALMMGDLLKQLSDSRGLIIAGEELADDFPSPAFLKTPDMGIQEAAIVISRNLRIDYGIVPDYASPGVRQMVDGWLNAFPYYRMLIEEEGKNIVPFNTGLIYLMDSIAKSGFEGYFTGGDYCELFRKSAHRSSSQNEGGSNPYLRAQLADPVGLRGNIFLALSGIANVTADVDPGLFSYAVSMGMREQFLGRMGHFRGLLVDSAVTSRAAVLE